LVLVAYSDIATSRLVKFKEKFKGPYYIYQKLENGAYKLQTKEYDRVLKLYINSQRLKLYYDQTLFEPTIIIN
ncbi:26613_t:CDS:1, partial [Racocetra persica]